MHKPVVSKAVIKWVVRMLVILSIFVWPEAWFEERPHSLIALFGIVMVINWLFKEEPSESDDYDRWLQERGIHKIPERKEPWR